MKCLTLATQQIKGKRVLLRADLNVPMDQHQITSAARLEAVLPTIKTILNAEPSQLLILSHLGRPTPGRWEAAYSLAPIAEWFAETLQRPIPLIKEYLTIKPTMPVALLENVRFNIGENENSEELAQRYAALGDLLVMEAFATAHRSQASTCGICDQISTACAGPLFIREVEALEAAIDHPTRPLIAIVGGAKISTKLPLLDRLAQRADQLIVGGGIANTLLAAQGIEVGDSIQEPSLYDAAITLLAQGKVAPIFDLQVERAGSVVTCEIGKLKPHDRIGDLGPKTMQAITASVTRAKTILWNGPLGRFEDSRFSTGTAQLTQCIAEANGFSVAGGGDTVAALEQYGREAQLNYVSTAGGAFLEFMEGKSLPGIEALTRNAERQPKE